MTVWCLLSLLWFPTQGDEDNMYKAVGTIGPVSIAYDVSGDFRFYKQGVYSR